MATSPRVTGGGCPAHFQVAAVSSQLEPTRGPVVSRARPTRRPVAAASSGSNPVGHAAGIAELGHSGRRRLLRRPPIGVVGDGRRPQAVLELGHDRRPDRRRAAELAGQLGQIAVDDPAGCRVLLGAGQAGAGDGRPSSSAETVVANSCQLERSPARARLPAGVSS